MEKIKASISAEQNITGKVATGIRYVNMGYNKEELDQMFKGKQNTLTVKQAENLNADHSKYLTEHQSLKDYAKKTELPTVPVNVSAFNNDAGYLTEHQDISGKQDVISDLATIRDGASKGATALQDISGKVDKQSGYSLVKNSDITQITTNKNAIALLNGDSEGSVIKCVQDEIAKVVANAPSDFDTLKEISDWIGNHKQDVTSINSAITDLQGDVEELASDLSDKADKEHTHSQYLTEHQDLSDYAKAEDMPIFSATYSIAKTSNGYIRANVITYDKFDSANDYVFISKATLNNVLEGRGYVTEEQVNGLINSALGVIENGTY